MEIVRLDGCTKYTWPLPFCPGSSFRSRLSLGGGTGNGPMISLRPWLITVHHSVSSLNDPAREAWLGKPGTPVGLIRRHRERRLDKHALIHYPTESGEKTVLRPST